MGKLKRFLVGEFLSGKGPDASGRFISEIYYFNDVEIEQNHSFIQWVFPLDEPSQAVSQSPILGLDEIAVIRENHLAQNNLRKSVVWYLGFLRRNKHWIARYNHNHLRITRVIKSLRLLVNDVVADEFKDEIFKLLGDQKYVIPQSTQKFWFEA